LAEEAIPSEHSPKENSLPTATTLKASRADYPLYKGAYLLYEETNPPETPRTRKDKLKIVFWITVILFSFAFMFYFGSQTSISCGDFGCP